jgi:hypothetical protein
MRRLSWLAIVLLAACTTTPKSLRPFVEDPWGLVAEVDRNVYSPVTAGLRDLKADLRIDVAGFYPAAERPAGAVWVPGTFVWKDGQGQFALQLPPGSALLEEQLMRTLQGKEEDLVNRPFAQRLAGDTLALSRSDKGLLQLVAVTPGGERWQLSINERFLVPRVAVQTIDLLILSDIQYDDMQPARIARILSRYEGGPQQTTVSVDMSYQQVNGFHIPQKVVYRGSVGRTEFPPLTLILENVRINTGGRGR